MKRIAYVALALILTMSLVFAGGCQSKVESGSASPSMPSEPVEIKLSIDLPETTDLAIACEQMAANIAERTDGMYLVKVYAGGTLCNQTQLFSMMESGAIEMGESPIEYQADADIRFTAVQLPFIFDNIESNYKFNKLINEKLFNDILAEKFKVMPIASFSTGIQEYCGTDQAVKTLDDWKGKLLWTANPMSAATATALEASPVTLEFWDGYPALQKGTVDAGISNIPFGVLSFKWYDAVHHISVANIFGSSSNIYINLDIFNSMPEEIQQIFLDEGQKLETEMQAIYTGYETSVLDDLEELGVEIYRVPADERALWIEATQSVRDDFYSQLDPADAQIIKDCVAEANQ